VSANVLHVAGQSPIREDAMPVLGIDLGRASCSAYVQFVDTETGDSAALHVEPVVVLTAKGEWLVGDDARRAAASGSGDAVWDLLTLQGRKLSDFSPMQLATWPFRLVPGIAGKALVEFQIRAAASLPRTVFAPEEILAVLLARVRQLAEQQAGSAIQDAVLTMPTVFHYTQRRALRDACTMAGLDMRRLIVGSTAASLAHVLGRGGGDQAIGELWVVVDYGAGSVDVSLVSAQGRSGAAADCLEVKAVAGDTAIGGDVLTHRIVAHFLRDGNIHAAVATPQSLHRLRRASQLAKKILSTSDVASVQLQMDAGAFARSITRAQLDTVCADCWRRIEELLQVVLTEGHATSDQVNGVLLCGGSAALPAVRDVAQRLFPTAALEVNLSAGLQARGAAQLAASLVETARSPLLLDVSPLALGVQRINTKEVAILIPANVRVPARGDSVFFVGSHVTELGYRVLEGRDLRQAMAAASSPHAPIARPHCIGTIRTLHAPILVSTAPKPVVTKLSIAFDLSEDLQLTASIATADLAATQPTTTTFLGDDSVLPRHAIARAKAELDRIFGGHRVVDEAPVDKSVDSNRPDIALKEYVPTLRRMVEAKALVVAISDDDARLLTAKIEELQEWLRSSPPHTDSRSSAGAETTDWEGDAPRTDEPARARLQALRRLHWSIAATAAIAQLRAELL
jgi:heat shock 70kDa protein 1/2/6/8